jgi:hypothetical protein
MKRPVIGKSEEFLQIDFEIFEEISLIAHFNGLCFFFDIRQERKTF